MSEFSTKALTALVVGGLTSLTAIAAADAQTAISHRVTSAPMSAAQLQQILQTAKPMDKRLTVKPDILNRSQIPTNGPPGPSPTVVQGNPGPSADAGGPGDQPDEGNGGASPQNYGTGNQNTIYHYSDYLVDTRLMRTYPYRASGYFLFQQLGSWYYCTGSLIAPSILLVAGHCVHKGNNSSSGWDTAGYFYPGATDANGGPSPKYPYGYASAYTFYTWSAWYSSGSLDQGYDVGLVILNRRNDKGTPANEMGRVTGWLGFCTSACLQTYWFFSQLGYPGNYYGGNRMSEGQHLYASDSRDYIWGSGMEGGSSGGPHIANIGSLSDSASNQGLWPYRNVVFAPTSWGYTDPQYKIQGGSALTGPNNSFDFNHNLYNPACNVSRSLHGTGSCTPFS